MKLHELKNTFHRQARKRVGRGDGSGNGRTAGRGDKGAGARAGAKRRPYFEGGQIPLIRRLPKRGFNNPNHVLFEVVNLSVLEESFEAGAEINREVLEARGLISKETLPLKVLADGDLTKAFKVTADRFSNAAKEKIEKAGGTATFLKPSSAEAKAARKAAFIAAKKEAVAKRKAAAAARGE
ncbi:MAG: 50S ribosomal protein L15 [Victivallales bacterium]|jgi:large subunit ribosomal protein L15|nr:50S ribosomal protein L15 [Victivallales bacterium]